MVIGTSVVPETSHSKASFNDRYTPAGSKECAIDTGGAGADADGDFFTPDKGIVPAIRP